ncbi:MAG: ABC transporter ATP-binding protein [Roseibium sp.]|uniref:ABC transporter ATP-binding protein n=1 Tax=Roseibium sp. TaxID=1936156 RepID=UPI002636AD7D|nr:ABC transporter ATP-binding protein [Roseibium sp.]MCV0426160.1 ABC transporter ATP-binding protein [Roseibium sp.]
MSDQSPVLSVRDLVTEIRLSERHVNLVRGVSFDLYPGEVLGVVGESGSGKSMTGSSIMNLLEPPLRIAGGSVCMADRDLTTLPAEEMRELRGDRVAMIFQDPMVSLNPVLTIGEQMIEAVKAHRKVSTNDARDLAIKALQKVGIPSPEKRLKGYPHEFSGGMRQRVVIAIAFLNNPDIIIADEPTTALDVTIQAQILSEIQKQARESGTAVIWITHDLALLSGFADRVMVMYAGEIVEAGSTADLISSPRHPYTQALIGAIPTPDRDTLDILEGFPPDLFNDQSGCSFAPRCVFAKDRCRSQIPEPAGENLSRARCFFPLHHEETT